MVQKIVVSLSVHELSHQCLIVDQIVGEGGQLFLKLVVLIGLTIYGLIVCCYCMSMNRLILGDNVFYDASGEGAELQISL